MCLHPKGRPAGPRCPPGVLTTEKRNAPFISNAASAGGVGNGTVCLFVRLNFYNAGGRFPFLLCKKNVAGKYKHVCFSSVGVEVKKRDFAERRSLAAGEAQALRRLTVRPCPRALCLSFPS